MEFKKGDSDAKESAVRLEQIKNLSLFVAVLAAACLFLLNLISSLITLCYQETITTKTELVAIILSCILIPVIVITEFYFFMNIYERKQIGKLRAFENTHMIGKAAVNNSLKIMNVNLISFVLEFFIIAMLNQPNVILDFTCEIIFYVCNIIILILVFVFLVFSTVFYAKAEKQFLNTMDRVLKWDTLLGNVNEICLRYVERGIAEKNSKYEDYVLLVFKDIENISGFENFKDDISLMYSYASFTLKSMFKNYVTQI